MFSCKIFFSPGGKARYRKRVWKLSVFCFLPADVPYAQPRGRGVRNPPNHASSGVGPRPGHSGRAPPLSRPQRPLALPGQRIHTPVSPSEPGSSVHYNLKESRGTRRRAPQQRVAHGRQQVHCLNVFLSSVLLTVKIWGFPFWNVSMPVCRGTRGLFFPVPCTHGHPISPWYLTGEHWVGWRSHERGWPNQIFPIGNDFSKSQILGFGSTQPSLAFGSKSGVLESKGCPGESLEMVALIGA